MEEGCGNEKPVITSIKADAPALTFFSFNSNLISSFLLIPLDSSWFLLPFQSWMTPLGDPSDSADTMFHNHISHKKQIDRRTSSCQWKVMELVMGKYTHKAKNIVKRWWKWWPGIVDIFCILCSNISTTLGPLSFDLLLDPEFDNFLLRNKTKNKKYRKAEYVQCRVRFVNVQSSLHENVVFSVCARMSIAAYIIFTMWSSGLDTW